MGLNTCLLVSNNCVVEASWNVMTHMQKPDFVFQRNGRVHLNRTGGRGGQFSRLLAAEVRASAVVMLDTTCSDVVWSVLAIQSIRQFPLHFPSRASSCAITFQPESTVEYRDLKLLHALVHRLGKNMEDFIKRICEVITKFSCTKDLLRE